MIDSFATAIERLAQRVAPGSRLLRTWELKGGVSARTIAFELVQAGGTTTRYVARCLPPDDDLRNDLDIAGEYRLLQALYGAGMPVPRPLMHTSWCEELRASVIVLDYVDGDTETDDRDVVTLLADFAAQIAMIHRLDWRRAGLSFLPDRVATWTRRLVPRPVQLDESLDEGAIRAILKQVWPLTPRNAPVLLHGDFWPGNVLWRDGQIAAVIDWEDAAIGDPLSDLAITRLELLWRFGEEAVETFSASYGELTGVDPTDLPYWDLLAALRPTGVIATWASTPPAEAQMRAMHMQFVKRALGELSSGSDR